MKFFLISDNHDTLVGMRMAGIEGVVVHEVEEVREAIRTARSDPETGIILITAKLFDLCRAEIYDFRLRASRPLIVEVADRHGDGSVNESITRYLREAVGIKV